MERVLLFMFVVLALTHFVAVSSTIYSSYQLHDKMTRLFTPDRQLLQVEYAVKAVDENRVTMVLQHSSSSCIETMEQVLKQLSRSLFLCQIMTKLLSQ